MWNWLKYEKWYRITILENLKRQRAIKWQLTCELWTMSSQCAWCPGKVVEYCEIQSNNLKICKDFQKCTLQKITVPWKWTLNLFPRQYEDENLSRNCSLQSHQNYYVCAGLWYYQMQERWFGSINYIRYKDHARFEKKKTNMLTNK